MNKRFALLLLVLAAVIPATPVSAKEVVGWVEKTVIYPGNIQVKSKIDTGAKTSSLHCECITPIKRNARDWVSFSVRNFKGEIIMLEKPVHRIAKIKRHFGETQERYVVKLGICLGSVYREEEVTLVDRSGFNYQMLIGRNFIKKDFLVDPGATFTVEPSCKHAPKQ